jgi:hypothetical protein
VESGVENNFPNASAFKFSPAISKVLSPDSYCSFQDSRNLKLDEGFRSDKRRHIILRETSVECLLRRLTARSN